MPPHTTLGHGPVARERAAGYEAAPPPSGPDQLPPALGELLDLTTTSDRVLARMLRLLVQLQSSGEVEATTGLQVEAWLAQRGRIARVDRKFLTTAADVLASMPATLAALAEGLLSWSQIRGIVTALRPLRTASRAGLDDEIAAAAHEMAGWDPEQIVWRVELLAADTLETDRLDGSDVEELLDGPDRPADTLVLQPRIDGSGGRLFGDYHDPIAYGTVENALSEQMGRPDALEPSVDDDARARNADRIGQARAAALVDICADSLAGTTPHTDGPTVGRDDRGVSQDQPGPGGPDAGASRTQPGTTNPNTKTKPAKPLVVATTTLDTLLGLSHAPGHLLTRTTGGRLRVDAASLRRLIDEGGAALRLIVLDDTGRAVGVGKRSYVPPGWVRETMLALQHECGTPGCRVAARLCDLDHVVAWPHGPTDVDNLSFACRRHHRDKTAGHWQVEVLPDGTRRHRHVRSGLTTDVPLTTRPLDAPALQPPRIDPPEVEPPGPDPSQLEQSEADPSTPEPSEPSEPDPSQLDRLRVDPPERRR